MEDENIPGPSREPARERRTPRWLKLLLRDCTREVGNSMILGEGMVAYPARTMIWKICRYFECDRSAVPGLTCRVLEQYLVHLTLNRFRGNIFALAEYSEPRLWLLMSCSYQLAAKATSSSLRFSSTDIHAFLVAIGCTHTIEDVRRTKWTIFCGIDCHIPPYNSEQMADMLAKHIGVEASPMIELTVRLAELHRPDIEAVTRILAAQRHTRYGNPRVYTLHLVAGCVAAAVQRASLGEPERTAQQLATSVQVSSVYIEVIREAVLVSCISFNLEAEMPSPRTRPIPPFHAFRNNTGRNDTEHPYSRRSEGSEPGTSK